MLPLAASNDDRVSWPAHKSCYVRETKGVVVFNSIVLISSVRDEQAEINP